jgi:hypothetical protein
MNEEESLEEQLKNLVVETCQHPQGTIQRQRGLNKLIRIMQRSGKIWRDSSPDYEDALQKTWLYFCLNLSVYDPTKASLITWFNNYLKWRLLDLYTERGKKPSTKGNKKPEEKPSTKGDKKPEEEFIVVDNQKAGIDIIGEIRAPEIYLESEEYLWDFVRRWIEDDSDGKFKGTHVRDRPDANAQFLCLRSLTYEKPNWQNLSTGLGISVSTLSSLYQRQCIPLLKEIPVIKQAYESRKSDELPKAQ